MNKYIFIVSFLGMKRISKKMSQLCCKLLSLSLCHVLHVSIQSNEFLDFIVTYGLNFLCFSKANRGPN